MYAACVESVKGLDHQPFNAIASERCLSWIDGFRVGFGWAELLHDGEGFERRQTYRRMFGCSLPDLTNEIFIRIFVKGLQDNPELLSGSYLDAIASILTKKFPCQ
jgi:Rap1a immunity proteins